MAETIVHPTAKATRSVKKEDSNIEWLVVDASGQTLGRFAAQVARLLRGKHKPSFTPHVDGGDHVIVINAEKIAVSDKRENFKEYFRYTGYPGGGRTESFKTMRQNKPERIIEHAVKGMIPKNRLGRQIIKKLKVYSGSEHPHQAQSPTPYTLPYSV